MRRHIPGLHSGQQTLESNLDGLFLVRVDKGASYRWHPQKPISSFVLSSWSRRPSATRSFPGRLYCSRPRALETELVPSRLWLRHRIALSRSSGMKKLCWPCEGSFAPPHSTVKRRSHQNPMPSRQRPRVDWPPLANQQPPEAGGEWPMVYSFTQISQYLRCPRSYRYRYLGRLARKRNSRRHGFRPFFRKCPGRFLPR